MRRFSSALDLRTTGNQRDGSASGVQRFFRRLNLLEIPLTRKVALACQGSRTKRLGIVVNRLGNGWLYCGVGIALPFSKGLQCVRPIAAALIAVGLSFLVYVPLKFFLARVRPCDLDPTLPRSMRTLDRFSCPSGHCMTAAAVSVPLAWSYPDIIPAILVIAFLIAWARIALAHHYLTDLFAGAIIGFAISLPISALLLR